MKPNHKMGQPFPDGLDAWLEENPPANPQGNCASLTAPTKHLFAGTVGQVAKPSTVKYIAQLKGVREVALLGAADLSWWRDHLADEELEPIEVDGRAQVLVSGLTSKWMGIPFREISVAVAARYPSDPTEEGFFLARGFNTSRFFTGFERWWFHTPYRYRADLHVELQYRAVISLGGRYTADLLAELGPREPAGSLASVQEMSFEGPLFLPTGRDRSRRRWFMARIQGLTYTFDFDDTCDRFALASRSPDPILVGLQASQFRGVQWQLRPNAAHARSKTFQARR